MGAELGGPRRAVDLRGSERRGPAPLRAAPGPRSAQKGGGQGTGIYTLYVCVYVYVVRTLTVWFGFA